MLDDNSSHKNIEATYQSITTGYSQPDYMQVELGSFKHMIEGQEVNEAVKAFLKMCKDEHIPDSAIVVMVKDGPLTLLVDGKGRLLSFR